MDLSQDILQRVHPLPYGSKDTVMAGPRSDTDHIQEEAVTSTMESLKRAKLSPRPSKYILGKFISNRLARALRELDPDAKIYMCWCSSAGWLRQLVGESFLSVVPIYLFPDTSNKRYFPDADNLD